MEPELVPVSRPFTDAELALAVAQAILDDRQNPGANLPFQAHAGELVARLGWSGRRADASPQFRHELEQFQTANRGLNDRLKEYCWRLVGLGFLVPDSSVITFVVTARGRAFFQGLDPAAIVPGGLDSRLSDLGFPAEATVRAYARYAQDCFLAGHDESAVVMLGVATEALVRSLAEAFSTGRPVLGLSVRQRPPRSTAAQDLTWLIDVLGSHAPELRRAMSAKGRSDAWLEPLASVLQGTGQAIRLTRNDLGHPTGFSITHDGALELLTLFPRFASTSVAALQALGQDLQ